MRNNAHRRFLGIFVRFVRAIAKTIQERDKKPIVLVLDDLQWTDTASLELLMAISVDKEVARTGGLLIVGTCRGDQVSFEDPLSIMLRDLETAGVTVTEICLRNLDARATAKMVAAMLETTIDETEELADWIFEKTGGNAFFVLQLLQTLQQQGLLFPNDGYGEKKWHWKADDCIKVNIDSVVQLYTDRMTRLPLEVQEVLKVASCVGVEFEENFVSHLTTTVVSSQILPTFCTMEEQGLIILDYDAGIGRWVHDFVQQAATLLIPTYEKEAFHLTIGRRLRDTMANDQRYARTESNIFLVVDQLLLGANLIESQEEKKDLAELCLRAGKSAVASSAFAVSSVYLKAGLSLLHDRSWRDHYELSLDLTNMAAEVSYWNGEFERVDKHVNDVFANARSFEDTVWAHNTSILSYGARNQTQIAIDKALDLLEKLGEKFPRRGNVYRILVEVVKTRRALRKVTDEEIMALPTMKDPAKVAVMQITGAIGVYLYWHRMDLFPLIAFRAIRICLRHGLTGIAGSFFGAFSVALVKMGEIELGHRYACLALRIQERFNTTEWLARTYLPVYSSVMPLKESFRTCLKPILRAHSAGLVSGDVEFSMLSASIYCQLSLGTGVPLEQLVEEIRTHIDAMEQHGQFALKMFTLPTCQFCMNLLGDPASTNPLALTGSVMDEKTLEAAFTDGGRSFMLTLRMVLAIHMGHFPEAGILMQRLRRLNTKHLTTFASTCLHFHECLTDAVLGREIRQRRLIRRARRGLNRMKTHFLNAPENYANKTYLVEAELSLYENQFDVASLHFQRSINCSRAAGLVHEQALAYERWGHAFLERNLLEKAIQCLKEARALYQEWNAYVIVNQLDEELAYLSTESKTVDDLHEELARLSTESKTCNDDTSTQEDPVSPFNSMNI